MIDCMRRGGGYLGAIIVGGEGVVVVPARLTDEQERLKSLYYAAYREAPASSVPTRAARRRSACLSGIASKLTVAGYRRNFNIARYA